MIFVDLYLFMILLVILPSKTTCRRGNRSSGEENDDKDDADCGQDDVGHVEAYSHNSSLSSLGQGHLKLKKDGRKCGALEVYIFHYYDGKSDLRLLKP